MAAKCEEARSESEGVISQVVIPQGVCIIILELEGACTCTCTCTCMWKYHVYANKTIDLINNISARKFTF